MLSVFMTTVPERADGPKFTKFVAGKQGIPIFFYLFYSYFNTVFSGFFYFLLEAQIRKTN